MLNIEKYISPHVGLVRLELEGVIADSHYPSIKNGEVQYYEYEEKTVDPYGGDVMILY
jgi:hypothetical protein